jgi:hypothetical protein
MVLSTVGLIATYSLNYINKTGLELIFKTALDYISAVNPVAGAVASGVAGVASVYLTKKILVD